MGKSNHRPSYRPTSCSKDSRRSSLYMPLLRWEERVPKTVIWKEILTWVKGNQEKLKLRKRCHDYKLSLSELKLWLETNSHFVTIDYRLQLEREIQAMEGESQALEEETQALEQEAQALEMILHWVTRCGKEVLERAEYMLDELNECRVRPIQDTKQFIKKLLELMEQDYWRTQHPTLLRTVPLLKKIFKTMLEEIPKLIGIPGSLALQCFTLEAQLSNALDEILQLSTWTPPSTHNKHLRELLRNALLMLNDLDSNEEYRDDLRDFMERHTAFCSFTMDNADLITSEDSDTTAELYKNLRQLAQNLGKIASTKAEQYQKLYENFIEYKEDLSDWLDLASPGQGKFWFGF